MKSFAVSSVLALAQLCLSAPTPTVDAIEDRSIEKRASVTDVATVGYATLNGGTTGGKGGATTTVSTLAQYTAAVAGNTAAVVVVSGTINGPAKNVKIGSNKTIIGLKGAQLINVGNIIRDQKNIIIRNLKLSKVLAENGDAIGVQSSTNIWLDHLDVSSDRDHDKDYYDGLIDLTHAADFITVSNTYLHDHWKASLVGHSDSNAKEDTGHLRVTYVGNHWSNINSRAPSLRFGTAHIFNSYFDVNDGINTRDGAQALVENNVFVGSKNPLYSTDAGYAVAKGNDFGEGNNTALAGTLNSVPYSYSLVATGSVKASVVGTAGQTLSF
ncbi:hypothetical protein ACN47E_001041 [Coniothyrium glycines]